jgi:hypothetical protein
MSHIIFPSILENAWLMAIDHFKERGIDVEFDLQINVSHHFCSVIHGLNQEELAKMDKVREIYCVLILCVTSKLLILLTFIE